MTRKYRVTLDFFKEYTCMQCGRQFVANAPNKVTRLYCSARCRSAYYRSHGRGARQKLPDDRICPGCGTAFKASAGKHYGRFCTTQCYQRAYQKKIYTPHSEKRQGRREYLKKWRKKNTGYEKARRLRAMEVVGNGVLKCSNCGCDKINILEIDHINGNGTKEHRQQTVHAFYTAIANGTRTTDDLRILCKVCNQLAYVQNYFGIKGHQVLWQKSKAD